MLDESVNTAIKSRWEMPTNNVQGLTCGEGSDETVGPGGVGRGVWVGERHRKRH